MSTESDDVRRGIVALENLRHQEIENAPDGLFEQILQNVSQQPEAGRRPAHFWLGAGFGAAVAASILVLAVAFGMLAPREEGATTFEIALNTPREMDIAIETDRELTGAIITIILAGNVELEGFAGQRELSWLTDLDAGVNRLSLPLIATGSNGGQLLVRLDHPQSEQVFVIDLKPEA